MPLVYFNAISTLTIFLTASLFGCAPLTLTQERQLGEEFERAVKREVVFFRDDIVVDYVDQLGREILRAAGSQPFEYTFQLIEDEEINAFAAPGGRIYMHTGTILKAENVCELVGVIVQFGGQTPLKLAHALHEDGVPILGTSLDSIDLAEDRERFQVMLHDIGLMQPPNGLATTADEAVAEAAKALRRA